LESVLTANLKNRKENALEHISTKKILADPLTKVLPPNIFQEHVVGMGLLESI
jgi:hypothetical protein